VLMIRGERCSSSLFTRVFPVTGVVLALSILLSSCGGGGSRSSPPPIDELTITDAQSAFAAHQLTCNQLVQIYLARIAINSNGADSINAILESNPDALTIADQLDQQFALSGPVGPMHCVPTIVKDNWGTADRTHTTAASLTMNGFVAPADAFAIAKLRAAGAVLIAKANMDEWAKGLTGYSSRGGQTLNPYKLNRGPGGSTGGSAAAVSANLGMVGTATDTFGSIQVPSSFNGLAGIRPTVGLVGRTGIIPEALFSDTPGPLARTVTDVAIALGVMTGVDPGDPATNASVGRSYSNYTQFLDPAGLKSAHLGVLRSLAGVPLSGDNSQVDVAITSAQQVMQGLGASITAEFDVPGIPSD
jgi:amidase